MTNDNNVAVKSPAIDVSEVFQALESWIKQRPGVDPRDYGDGRDRLRAYRQEVRAIGQDRKRAMKALDEARGLYPAEPAILADSFRAFSGRLEWKSATLRCGYCEYGCTHCNQTGKVERMQLEYCTGQYWPTEYRKAAAAVLETYVSGWRRHYALLHPPTFTYRTIEDVKAANRAVGGHWFDADTMRFFHTKIESGLVACGFVGEGDNCKPTRGRFITSERPRHRRAPLYDSGSATGRDYRHGWGVSAVCEPGCGAGGDTEGRRGGGRMTRVVSKSGRFIALLPDDMRGAFAVVATSDGVGVVCRALAVQSHTGTAGKVRRVLPYPVRVRR